MDAGQERFEIGWPGFPRYWVNAGQLRAMRVLVDAYLNGADPDVKDETLLRAARSPFPSMGQLFAGTAVFGELVLRGKAPGTCRMAPPRAPDEDRVWVDRAGGE